MELPSPRSDPIIEHVEDSDTKFNGTVIDIETIGEFDPRFSNRWPPDSREYGSLKQVIFGYIDAHHLSICCANGHSGIRDLEELAKRILNMVEMPIYAFNCHFEMGVFFHHLGLKVQFHGELQTQRESKRSVVRALEIDNYGDPFYDRGRYCMDAWEKGHFSDAIAHNRACLLKERDILLKRGFRKPDPFLFMTQS